MRTNYSNFNEYPHRVFASVVLLNGEIINWKTGNYRWTKESIRSARMPKIAFDNWDKLEIRSRSFVVKNTEQHNRAFCIEAKNFYKQFPLPKNYDAMRPY